MSCLLSAQTPRADRDAALESFDEAWQTVADTFYDPAFGGVDWPAVRAELRPRAEAAASATEIRALTRDMLARLNRSHFTLASASDTTDTAPLGPATVPIDVRVAPEGVVVVTVWAAGAGLAPGQILEAIDGVSLANWRTPVAPPPAARREMFDLWRRSRRLLTGADGSIATIVVRDGSALRTVRVPRVREGGETVTLGHLGALQVRTDVKEMTTPAGRRVGVIGFNVWMTAIDAPFADAIDRFRDAPGLVVDLRGNPGGLAAMMSGIAGHFLDEPALLGRMQTRQAQLEFRANPRLATADGRRVRPYSGRLALLVDELTGSTSECFAGGLQDLGRARVFGRQTMGEALPALTKRLPSGDVLMYVIGNFVTAAGRSIEGVGVVPDQAVPLSVPGLSGGRDDTLNAALRWLDGG